MTAQYLLRFDDLCPTMNWRVWMEIENLLLETGIRPILAIVPDNKDPKLVINTAKTNFWDEVRRWQSYGWTIGLHGYQHVYTTRNPGIVGTSFKSEFAGVSKEEQENKLKTGIAILAREGISPQVWIAPSHSFDLNTISILNQIGLRVISDGFGIWPHMDASGMLWVPQQLWRFRKRPFGVWTVCFHHNNWSKEQTAYFKVSIGKYRHSITDLEAILETYPNRRQQLSDKLYSVIHNSALHLRIWVS